jgi:Ca2+-binding RTX toxin-like protein
VLRGGRRAAGRVFVRRGRLIARGAPGTRNRLTARRRGRTWRISDAAAPLLAGAGCRRLAARSVSCRAAGVRRVELYGGAGDDRLRTLGPVRALLLGGPGDDRLIVGRGSALLLGGPGNDRLTGGPGARFRGGPGSDLARRRSS